LSIPAVKIFAFLELEQKLNFLSRLWRR